MSDKWHQFDDKPTTPKPAGEGWAWISGEWKKLKIVTDTGDGVPDKLDLPKPKPDNQ